MFVLEFHPQDKCRFWKIHTYVDDGNGFLDREKSECVEGGGYHSERKIFFLC